MSLFELQQLVCASTAGLSHHYCPIWAIASQVYASTNLVVHYPTFLGHNCPKNLTAAGIHRQFPIRILTRPYWVSLEHYSYKSWHQSCLIISFYTLNPSWYLVYTFPATSFRILKVAIWFASAKSLQYFRHPPLTPLTILPPGIWYWIIRVSKTGRICNSFFPVAIRLVNTLRPHTWASQTAKQV